MRAPAATCATASACTVVMSPAQISAVSFARPVGLMRSPMIANGCSSPMRTSPPGPDRTVVATVRHCASPTSLRAISTASGALFA